MYDITAFLYESTAAFEEPERMANDLHALLGAAGIQPPGWLGDFGSGTGLMARLLAAKGWSVCGVERSTAMLAVAREKAVSLPAEVQARLHWLQGDITQLKLPQSIQLDAAVCLCNTLNHLAEPGQLQAFIASAFNALKPDAILMLDTDRLETFQGYFHHPPTVVWQDQTGSLTRACTFDERTGLAHHTAILMQADTTAGEPHRQEESMWLRYYADAEILEAFQTGGFQLEGAMPYNPSPRLYQGFWPKTLWAFRKRDRA